MQGVNGQITKSCKMKSKISLKNTKSVKSTKNHPHIQLYPYLWQAISKKPLPWTSKYIMDNTFSTWLIYAPAYLLLHSSQIKTEAIIKHIFRIWIAANGTPEKFLTDNNGEFANREFLEMADYLSTTVHITAAESPWSNESCWEETPNQTLTHMMDKIIAETNTSPDLALTWALNAKNSLQNVAGFSPFQLVFATNFKLPATLSDDLPALSIKLSSQIVQENLNAIHSWNAAFITSDNFEEIWWALLHNVQTSSKVKYIKGDVFLYKRNDSNKWQGAGIVIGQINQQASTSFYVRVHPVDYNL